VAGVLRKTIWPIAGYAFLTLLALTRINRPVPVAYRPQRKTAADAAAIQRPSAAEPEDRPDRPASIWRFPWAEWKAILYRTYSEALDDRLLAIAAGVVFYGLLALFPALAALVSLYSLFGDPATISQHLSAAQGVLPEGAFNVLRDEIGRLTGKGHASLSLVTIIGLLTAIWSANAGMKAIIDALNVVYDETEKRGFIRLNLVSLGLTAGAFAAILLAIGAVVVLPLFLAFFQLGGAAEVIISLLRWPFLIAIEVGGLAALYRFAPNRKNQRWQWITPGSLAAAVAWLVGSLGLSWYLANFADYDATYGSLGAGVGLMMWMWISAIVILLGAELNAEIEHQVAMNRGKSGPAVAK
jgi:membrane protein